MNLEEFRARRRELTRFVVECDECGDVETDPAQVEVVREEMRRTLFDDIAAAAMPDLLALLDADLTIARSYWDNA
jgi:hypothetical protein